MTQEVKYSEDFIGADGSLPDGWSDLTGGDGYVGVSYNKLSIKATDGYAYAFLDSYQFSSLLNWEFVASLNISGISLSSHKVGFLLLGDISGAIGLEFYRIGAQRKIRVYTMDTPTFSIDVPGTPISIRLIHQEGLLFIDYSLGHGYEFNGGPALVTTMAGNSTYAHRVNVSASHEYSLYPEVELQLNNYLVTGDIEVFSLFWHNHTLQTELVEMPGSLMKYPTRTIIRSTGQRYIGPTGATEPKSSSGTGINYVCERVA